jgi:NitT/TauT family transport system ATP-binding protein
MSEAMTEAGAASLTIEDVAHAYFGRMVLEDVRLAVARGEIVALVGPSGCGKSTLAHIAAGIVRPLRGRVSRHYRRHGMVFQEPRLLPWATARANIAYPLRFPAMSRAERRDRVQAAAQRAALADADLDKYPVELSGGMKQRVAIARALAVDPDFVFFDEPFTALDLALRRRMQDLVVESARSMRFAALFITHDVAEAFRVAHRVAVMEPRGRGIAGDRALPGLPGLRSENEIHRNARTAVTDDPLFRHIHDVDERNA